MQRETTVSRGDRWTALLRENPSVVPGMFVFERLQHMHRGHSEIYGDGSFRMAHETVGNSAGVIACSIAKHFALVSIADLGCGLANHIRSCLITHGSRERELNA